METLEAGAVVFIQMALRASARHSNLEQVKEALPFSTAHKVG
jgi:hypothetical protein